MIGRQDERSMRPPLTLARIARTWWPLAASWLFMSAELPAIVAVVARLPEAEVNLAAFGGVVFPLALIVESPVIMLLAASTALCQDWEAYRRMYRWMMWAGAVLTAAHLAVAATPLYFVVVRDVIGAPEAIVGPARLGLILMTPWTWAIAYRRFHQGVLIRYGRSRTVGVGTAVRLAVDAVLLAGGYAWGGAPGVAVGAAAISAGVVAEALYARRVVRPVLTGPLRDQPRMAAPITLATFLRFYVPLVLTSFLTLVAQPIGSAAISRMPQAMASLAAWPAIAGLLFILRSGGIAFNEVVVALLDAPGSTRPLRRFTRLLAVGGTVLTLLLTATPLADAWFGGVAGLPPDLAGLARQGLPLIWPLAALSVLQSWYQGALLHARRTRGVTEAVAVYLAVSTAILAAGTRLGEVGGAPTLGPSVAVPAGWRDVPGVVVALVALAAASAAQTAWLAWRSGPARRAAAARDAEVAVSNGPAGTS